MAIAGRRSRLVLVLIPVLVSFDEVELVVDVVQTERAVEASCEVPELLFATFLAVHTARGELDPIRPVLLLAE